MVVAQSHMDVWLSTLHEAIKTVSFLFLTRPLSSINFLSLPLDIIIKFVVILAQYIVIYIYIYNCLTTRDHILHLQVMGIWWISFQNWSGSQFVSISACFGCSMNMLSNLIRKPICLYLCIWNNMNSSVLLHFMDWIINPFNSNWIFLKQDWSYMCAI